MILSNTIVQQLLNKRGYGPLEEDGKIGPHSLAAIKKFQADNNFKVDGIISADLIASLIQGHDNPTPGPIPPIELDTISLQRIKKLHPKVRAEAEQILGEITSIVDSKNAFCRYTYTLRTFKEQDELYAQGRTKPGPIVTNSRGGQSIHNFGLAIDIAFVINGTEASWSTTTDWNQDNQSDWMEVVAIFKKHGWAWGGDWRTFKDMPHFDKTGLETWHSLLAKYQAGKVDSSGYVSI